MRGRFGFVKNFLLLWVVFYPADVFTIETETMRVKLGEHGFNIPKKNILDPGFPFWLQFVPGLAPSAEGMLLTIDAEEMAARVEGYQVYDGKYKAFTSLIIEVPDDAELKTYLDPEFHIYSDAWYGRGFQANQVIERHDVSGFYKAYRGDDTFWTALRMIPDSTQPIPTDPFSFWVASCVAGNSPLTQTGRITNCKSRFFTAICILTSGYKILIYD